MRLTVFLYPFVYNLQEQKAASKTANLTSATSQGAALELEKFCCGKL